MAPQPADAPACSPLWQSFVQAFTDQLHARGRAAPPPPVKVEPSPAGRYSPRCMTRNICMLSSMSVFPSGAVLCYLVLLYP